MYLVDYMTFKKTSAFFLTTPCKAAYCFIATLLILLGVFFMWAYLAPIDEVVKASVKLRPAEPISTIRCTTSGEVVHRNYINNGEVEKNQLLFALDTTAKKKELEADRLQLQQNDENSLVQNLLLKTIQTQTLPDAPKDSAIYTTAASYMYKKKHYESLVAEAFTKLQGERNMPKGLYVPQNVIDSQLQYDQQVLEYETWQSSFYAQTLESCTQLESKRKALLSAISELERSIKNATIYAPISGIITEKAKLNIGDYIISGEEILTITPVADTSLQADIYIDPAYAAKVQVDNPAYIKFPGLPPSQYGLIKTYVSSLPPDTTLLDSGTQVFIVEAPLQQITLTSRHGQTVRLVSGLSAEARVVIGHTTVMQLLLKKLDFLF